MKKLLNIFFLFFSLQTFAEGNLQFNQVLTYSGTINCGQASPTWTVPAGKVWKIEYRSTVSGNPNFDNSQGVSGPYGPLFSLNGVKVSDTHFPSNSQPTNSWGLTADTNLPMWLKSGDQIQFSNNALLGNCSDYLKYNYAISILEYNIIP